MRQGVSSQRPCLASRRRSRRAPSTACPEPLEGWGNGNEPPAIWTCRGHAGLNPAANGRGRCTDDLGKGRRSEESWRVYRRLGNRGHGKGSRGNRLHWLDHAGPWVCPAALSVPRPPFRGGRRSTRRGRTAYRLSIKWREHPSRPQPISNTVEAFAAAPRCHLQSGFGASDGLDHSLARIIGLAARVLLICVADLQRGFDCWSKRGEAIEISLDDLLGDLGGADPRGGSWPSLLEQPEKAIFQSAAKSSPSSGAPLGLTARAPSGASTACKPSAAIGHKKNLRPETARTLKSVVQPPAPGLGDALFGPRSARLPEGPAQIRRRAARGRDPCRARDARRPSAARPALATLRPRFSSARSPGVQIRSGAALEDRRRQRGSPRYSTGVAEHLRARLMSFRMARA